MSCLSVVYLWTVGLPLKNYQSKISDSPMPGEGRLFDSVARDLRSDNWHIEPEVFNLHTIKASILNCGPCFTIWMTTIASQLVERTCKVLSAPLACITRRGNVFDKDITPTRLKHSQDFLKGFLLVVDGAKYKRANDCIHTVVRCF